MRTLLALAVTAILLLTGCSGSDPVGAEPDPKASTTPVWEFSGTTLDGDSFDARTIAGTPTVVWFWAPWCPTCRAQIPTVTSLAEQYDGKVEFIAAGGLAEDAEIRELAKDIDHVTHLVDLDGTIWKHFGITEQSTYVVINADGSVLAEGKLSDTEITEHVAKLAG